MIVSCLHVLSFNLKQCMRCIKIPHHLLKIWFSSRWYYIWMVGQRNLPGENKKQQAPQAAKFLPSELRKPSTISHHKSFLASLPSWGQELIWIMDLDGFGTESAINLETCNLASSSSMASWTYSGPKVITFKKPSTTSRAQTKYYSKYDEICFEQKIGWLGEHHMSLNGLNLHSNNGAQSKLPISAAGPRLAPLRLQPQLLWQPSLLLPWPPSAQVFKESLKV